MAIDQHHNTPLLITIGAVSGFLLLVLVIGVQAWFLREVQRETRIKYEDVPAQPVTDLKLEQLTKIHQPRWVDQGKGRVVRRMFTDIDADVYVLVDGDATYDAPSARAMIGKLVAERVRSAAAPTALSAAG